MFLFVYHTYINNFCSLINYLKSFVLLLKNIVFENLYVSLPDAHRPKCIKPPGFHPKYLILCSEDKRSFYGFGTTWGYFKNKKIIILAILFAPSSICSLQFMSSQKIK